MKALVRLMGIVHAEGAPHVGIWPRHLSLQGLRLDRTTTLPLAVLMLPKPRARTIGRLDGGGLSKMGHSARRDDHLPR